MTCDDAAERARDLQERRRIEPEARREHEAFRERQPVEPEDVIDRELGAPAVAVPADVKTGGEHRIEDRRHLGCRLRIAADQADTLAAPHLLAGAGHRRFEEAQPLRCYARGERGDPVRIAGAGGDHDGAGRRIGRQRVRHLLDLLGAEHGEHDRMAAARDIRERCRRRAAELGKPLGAGAVDVDAEHREARRHQPAGQHFAHQAEADQSDRLFAHLPLACMTGDGFRCAQPILRSIGTGDGFRCAQPILRHTETVGWVERQRNPPLKGPA